MHGETAAVSSNGEKGERETGTVKEKIFMTLVQDEEAEFIQESLLRWAFAERGRG